MALIDYKIVRFSRDNRRVTAHIRVYRGAVTTEQELVIRDLQDVTRYRRIAVVANRYFSADVPRDMTRDEFITKVRAYLNKRLIDFATANGHTVITEQQDISQYEDFLNEVIT